MEQREAVQIALAFNDSNGEYARHAGVVMTSVFANTARAVCVHIMHDDTLSPENRLKLQQIALSFRQQICFYPVQISGQLRGLNCGVFTCGALYRLWLAQILTLDKVIYLDCDIVVELDVSELWEVKLVGFPVAAVREQGIRQWPSAVKHQVKAAGISLAAYFNSGVIVFDLARIRRQHDLPAELAVFLRRSFLSFMLDQDFLNRTFQRQCYWLADKYNRMASCRSGDLNPDDYAGNIWHFTGVKPWKHYQNACDLRYWHYLLQTPWRQEAWQGLALMSRERQRIVSSRCWRLTAPCRAMVDLDEKKGRWG